MQLLFLYLVCVGISYVLNPGSAWSDLALGGVYNLLLLFAGVLAVVLTVGPVFILKDLIKKSDDPGPPPLSRVSTPGPGLWDEQEWMRWWGQPAEAEGSEGA